MFPGPPHSCSLWHFLTQSSIVQWLMNFSTTDENFVREFCNCVPWCSDQDTKQKSRLLTKTNGRSPAPVKWPLVGKTIPKNPAFFLKTLAYTLEICFSENLMHWFILIKNIFQNFKKQISKRLLISTDLQCPLWLSYFSYSTIFLSSYFLFWNDAINMIWNNAL